MAARKRKSSKKAETRSATLNHFPPDTKVQVFEKTGDSFDGGGMGKKCDDSQVGTDGSFVTTGLKPEQEYWAVGDTGQVVAFVAADPEPPKSAGRSAQTSAGDGRRASAVPGLEASERPSGGAKAISSTQLGGTGRTLSSDDDKAARTETPGDATQKPPVKRKAAKKARKAPAKKAVSSGRKAGRKGIRGARSTTSAR